MQDRIFYSITFGFIIGVFLRSFLFLDLYFLLVFCVLAFFGIIFFTLISKNKWGIIVSIFIFAFFLGILRFHFFDKSIQEVFESNIGNKVEFLGIIIDEPDIRENNQKLTIEIKDGQDKTKILATVNPGQDFKYGDKLSIKGKLTKPKNFITDTGKEFDYINYLKKDGIYFLINYAEIKIIGDGGGNFIKRNLFIFKENFLEKINFIIRSPESLLMGGLILGEKASFSNELREKFIDTGTIHIIALSGYNITIVAEYFIKIFSFLPKNFGLGVGIFSIILFILMTGGASTAVRAGIMAVLLLIARFVGRDYNIGRALIFAGVMMVFFNPFILVFDVSFQLSFLATIAVIYLSPKIKKYFLWVTKSFGLQDIFSVTIAAYIFVLPFILYKMGILSLVAIPANILILPFIPFTMLLGFLTGFVGLISYFIAIPFGYISYLFLHYELGVINILSSIPFTSFTIANFPLIFVLLIYTYFIYKLFRRSIKKFFIFEPE